MASLNKVFLLGNLTRDPDLRYTTGGAAVCKFGLAVNRRFNTSSGEEREETCFVDLEVWGRQAETCDQYLRKGAPALVEGRLQFDQWEDRESGKKRSRLLVRADRVQFLGAPSSGTFGQDSRGDRDDSHGGTQNADDGEEDAAIPGMPPFEDVGEENPDDIPF